MANDKKRPFWYLTLSEILTILCTASIPVALGIYTVITSKQEQDEANQRRQFDLESAAELRQQNIFDKFLKDIYTLDKDGHLNEDKNPWAFANAYFRAAQCRWDALRNEDILQFLKERQLIGRNNNSKTCQNKQLDDIIRLNKLNFDNVHIRSRTGTLNHLNLEYISFDQISMINATFSFVNLNDGSFNYSRLNHAKFEDSSLVCASFDHTELQGTDFGNSYLADTRFVNVDLSTAKLTDEQIQQAIFINTTLPNGTLSGTTSISEILN